MVQYEKEICAFLGIPSIPKREWNKKSSFKDGVAIVNLSTEGFQAYAACTFDAEVDKEPRIKKVFSTEQFTSIERIFVVPSYMDLNTEDADLDDASKEAAQRLAEEAKELTEEQSESDAMVEEMQQLPEWVFPEINDKEQAIAWLRQYNQANKIKGKVPTNEETIKMRLLNIYYSQKKKQ